MSLRPIFAILIAAAMLFSPFAMRGGMAVAAVPGNHHGQMMVQDHCSQPAKDRDAGTTGDKNCCAAMCANVALPAASAAEPLAYVRSIDQPAIAATGKSFLAKLPTPPPRTA